MMKSGSLGCILLLAIIIATIFLPHSFAFAGDVSLAWDPNTEPVLAGYWLFYGTDSGQYSTQLDVGNVNTFTISNLGPGTYYFAAKAYGINGEQSGFSNEAVKVIAPVDTTPPVVSIVRSLNVTTSAATISWTTNEGSDSQIDYGTTASYGASTVLNTSLVASHSQNLTGLVASTTYHYRVKSKDAAGNIASSGDFTFTTATSSDTTPPVISNVGSSIVTTSAATIRWTTNEGSDSQIDYGTTASYGASTTLNSFLVTSHSQVLIGLSARRTYHYRVKSKDAAGNIASSGDFTFTTATPQDTTPPVISNVGSSNVTTSAATISWTTNEGSDSQIDYGTTASYGASTVLNTSLVASHSQNLTGLVASTTYHYRVKSKDASGNIASSGDFTFTTATPPDTTPPVISNVGSSNVTTSAATISWTTNEGSDSQIDYGTTASYGASTVLNTSLVASHSQNLTGLVAGTTYHYRVKSKDAAGNIASSGDFTFTTATPPDTTPPVISNVGSSNVSTSAATISWTTNEGSDSQIDYGTTASYGTSTVLNTSLVASHSQNLTGLVAGTTYHYRVKSKDAAGNIASSGDFTFTTATPPDTTPPVISNVGSSNVSTSAATISWTTNEGSDSQIDYGTTASYGASTVLNTSLVASHSQNLTGLVAGTTYHYRVKSKDAAGNLASSGDYTFTTATPSDTTPPVISNVGSSNVSTSAATISWTTNEGSDSQIDYGTTASYGTSTVLNTSLVASHSQNLTGLVASTTYHYRVKSKDAAGNLASSGDFTFTTATPPDTTPPVISNVDSSNVSTSAATISWTTNEGSDSQIDYGTTASYGASTVLNTSLVASHSQNLTGLVAGTTYHYRVKSKDAAGNLASSGDYTFTTATPSDTTPPVISNVGSSNVTTSAATISWTTNEGSDSQIDYGTTASYGASTVLNTSLVASHSQNLTGLVAGTTYHYRVKSKDAPGNLASSGDFTFTTATPPDTTPPVISNVGSSNVTTSAATISWTTNEGSDSQIDYETTASYGASTVLNTSLVASHSQNLMGLVAGTTYHYRVKSKDAAGNIASSGDYTFTTATPPDTTPPVISNVGSSNVTTSAATISWTTNEGSDSQIDYGTTASYGASTVLNTSLVASHSQNLTGLVAGTTYHYSVKSKDAAGNLASSGDFTFTTATPPDTTPPVISNVDSSNVSTSAATISWTTNEGSDSQIDYGTTASYGTSTVLNTSLVASHSQNLTGLVASTTYHYSVKSKDAAGNIAASRDYTFTTNSGLIALTSINISKITNTSATITWITNRPTNSEVEYWMDISSPRISALSPFVTNHTLALNQLQPLTHYYCRVRSTDARDNYGISDILEFNTTDMVAADFVMPRFSAGQNFLGDDSMIEMGLAVGYSESATLKLTAFDDNGILTTGTDINNPVFLSLTSQTQMSGLDSQVFGNGLSNSHSNGWIKIETNTPDVHGRFLFYDSSMTFLDGVNFDSTQLTDSVFTDIQTDGYNKISVINDNLEYAAIYFDLVAADGRIRRTKSRIIPSQGSLAVDIFSDLFPNDTPNATDYVIARSSKGVQAFQVRRQNTGDIAALTAQDISAGASILYSPQYSVGGFIRTTLSVINLDSVVGTVRFRFIGNDGVQLGATRTLLIPPKGKLYIDDQNFFLTPATGVTMSGYVEIVSNGLRLTGSATFGDSNRNTFLAAMALIYNLEESLFYSTIISNDTFFTSMTFLNPNQATATVTIEAYDATGALIGTDTELLNAGQRISQLLTQYIPVLLGNNEVSGYVIVNSDQPIASFSTLGANNLSTMSALPPTRRQ